MWPPSGPRQRYRQNQAAWDEVKSYRVPEQQVGGKGDNKEGGPPVGTPLSPATRGVHHTSLPWLGGVFQDTGAHCAPPTLFESAALRPECCSQAGSMPQGQLGKAWSLAVCFQSLCRVGVAASSLGLSRRVRPPSQPQPCQGQDLARCPAPHFLSVGLRPSSQRSLRAGDRTFAARGAFWSNAHHLLWIQVRPYLWVDLFTARCCLSCALGHGFGLPGGYCMLRFLGRKGFV